MSNFRPMDPPRWCTGMPLPIAEIASICHERGILLVLDGSQSVGPVRVRERILELTLRLYRGLSALGFGAAYQHGDAPQSGILSVRKPGVDVDRLSSGLAQRGFVTRVRLGHLRLAPHVYLSPDQMDATATAIDELSRE